MADNDLESSAAVNSVIFILQTATHFIKSQLEAEIPKLSAKAELQQVRQIVVSAISFVQVMTITGFTYFADHAFKIAQMLRLIIVLLGM